MLRVIGCRASARNIEGVSHRLLDLPLGTLSLPHEWVETVGMDFRSVLSVLIILLYFLDLVYCPFSPTLGIEAVLAELVVSLLRRL